MKVILYSLGFIYDVVQLANSLSQKIDTTLLIPIQGYQSFVRDAKSPVLSPMLNTFFFKHHTYPSLREVKSIVKKIEEINPDVIHLQPCTWLNLALPFLKKYPIVTTIHDVFPMKGRTMTMVNYPFQILQMGFSDKLLDWGNYTKKLLQNRWGISEKKIDVVPYGGHEIFQKWGVNDFAESKNIVLFFGQIHEHKGLDYLIKSEPIVRKEVPDLKIIIAGKGRLPPELADKTKDKSFQVHNYFIPYPYLIELLKKSSIVAFPYIEATQSGGMFMAFAFEKAIVATKVGNFPEYVDAWKTGLIVPPKDPNALAEAIIYLLKNEDVRRKMGREGYNKMKSEFSWDISAKKHIQIYERLLKEKSKN